MKRNDLDGVLPLLAVVEQGSFRAAASRLGVTPSAISQAVKQLEERIGVPLLVRTTRSVGLTHWRRSASLGSGHRAFCASMRRALPTQ